MPTGRPTAADRALAEAVATGSALPTTGSQVQRWARHGLLPHHTSGPGRTRTRQYLPGASEQGVEIRRLLADQITLSQITLILFALCGRTVEETAVRNAYTTIYAELEADIAAMIQLLEEDTDPNGRAARRIRAYAQHPYVSAMRERLRDTPATTPYGPLTTKAGTPRRTRVNRVLRTIFYEMLTLAFDEPASAVDMEQLKRAFDIPADEEPAPPPTLEEVADAVEQSSIEDITRTIDIWRTFMSIDAAAAQFDLLLQRSAATHDRGAARDLLVALLAPLLLTTGLTSAQLDELDTILVTAPP